MRSTKDMNQLHLLNPSTPAAQGKNRCSWFIAWVPSIRAPRFPAQAPAETRLPALRPGPTVEATARESTMKPRTTPVHTDFLGATQAARLVAQVGVEIGRASCRERV